MQHVGRRNIDAERVAETGILVPIANMSGRYPIGASESVEKAREPTLGIGDGSSAAHAFSQRDGTLYDFYRNTAINPCH